MTDAIRLLDHDKDVERYAWFAPRVGGDWLGSSASLLQPDLSALTQLGRLYTSDSSGLHFQQETADQRLWTDVCRPCFAPEGMQLASLNQTARQLCADCGFRLL